jgi:hypothetical protein
LSTPRKPLTGSIPAGPNGNDPFHQLKPDAEFGTIPTASTNDPSAPDPFDVSRLRIDLDDDTSLGVKELLVNVPYRKPSKESFIRVHRDAAYRCTGGLIELKDDESESYWVDPILWPHLADEPTFGRRLVLTAITRQGATFLWGLRLPGADGKVPSWVSIPLEAARSAETHWTKIFWDQSQRQHRIKVSETLSDEPRWPELPFTELLRLAIKDRVISSLDHSVLKRLRGEF